MKANELRIGNLYDNFGTIKVVSADTILEVWKSERKWCKPISLTEYWLLKFGFERTYNSQFRLKYDLPCDFIGFDISKTEEKSMEGFRYFGHYIKIKYVHQLQNLYFAITGQELTINN